MEPKKTAREQHIAVFGESGSGKTVLVSSFYGSALEPAFADTSFFNIVADDVADGRRLHQNYLGMKNSSTLPLSTRATTSYAFSIKRRPGADAAAKKPAEDLRLVWHDYPGEWFESEPESPTEGQRRLATFRALLGSDVAVVLVDAQRLIDNAGEEERYLKALLSGFKTNLVRLHEELLPDRKPLVQFPRIWLIALSKADLLPDMDVDGFRDLMTEKAAAEMSALGKEISTFVEAPEALSVGEDFLLLSSAKFEPGKIEVSKRTGLDLILPIAAMLPFARHLTWAKRLKDGGRVAKQLLDRAGPLLLLFNGKVKFPGPIGVVAALVLPKASEALAKLAGTQLQAFHDRAVARHDFLTAVLTQFQLDLERGEKKKVLIRSIRSSG
ncbi:TRAFAC clade GTPase domain-containing protein [Clavibacter sp. MX14-G9D]|uniref:TRAFAC clade GTPase domain-containing protein n=1 Tax=Clavibacter sp. MX14-G9D TaxID=3064656 RepID=UPI00293E4AA1|nr:ATP/GTP-binding protein [Clavibacter sp. MX14-G9D]